jgi:hypothetical protein
MINNPNAQKTSPNNLMPSRIYFLAQPREAEHTGRPRALSDAHATRRRLGLQLQRFQEQRPLVSKEFAGYFPGSRRIRQLGISRHFRRNTRVEHRSSAFVVDDIADFSILTQRYRNHVVKFHTGSGGDLDGTRQVH